MFVSQECTMPIPGPPTKLHYDPAQVYETVKKNICIRIDSNYNALKDIKAFVRSFMSGRIWCSIHHFFRVCGCKQRVSIHICQHRSIRRNSADEYHKMGLFSVCFFQPDIMGANYTLILIW